MVEMTIWIDEEREAVLPIPPEREYEASWTYNNGKIYYISPNEPERIPILKEILQHLENLDIVEREPDVLFLRSELERLQRFIEFAAEVEARPGAILRRVNRWPAPPLNDEGLNAAPALHARARIEFVPIRHPQNNAPILQQEVFEENQHREAGEALDLDLDEVKKHSDELGLLTMNNKLSNFKIDFSEDEISQRLTGTIISINSSPFFIEDSTRKNKECVLICRNSNGDRKRIPYSKIETIRSIQPGYVPYDGRVKFLCRLPLRQVHQGVSRQNCFLIPVGGNLKQRSRIDEMTLLEGLSKRKTRKFKESLLEALYENDLKELYLSPQVALYKKQKDVCLEYRGYTIGKIENQYVKSNPEFMCLPCLAQDLNKLNLEVRF